MLRTVAEWENQTGADRLTPAEMRLIRAVRVGEGCRLGDTVPEAMTPDTRIRAALLRLLMLGGTPDCGLHEKGVTRTAAGSRAHSTLAIAQRGGRPS